VICPMDGVCVAEEFDLLSAVQPEEGWYAIVGISPDRMQQELVEPAKRPTHGPRRFSTKGRNVIFWCS